MPPIDERQRIGVFGGTFDPIHIGHLLLAESAREQLKLDEVRFVPAAQSPLKIEQDTQAVAKQRAEMVGLAINGNSAFTLDDREIRRGGTSFTVETLRELHHEVPARELFFLMGADSLADFHRWKRPVEICQLAYVVVMARGGYSPPDMKLLEPHLPEEEKSSCANHLLAMPQIEISSSDLRTRLSTGKSTRYQLPAAVQAYIDAQQIYRE